MMLDPDEIKKQGIKILEEFSDTLADIVETSKTHYVVDLHNVWRPDGKPVKDKTYRDRFKKIVPKWEENYVICEED